MPLSIHSLHARTNHKQRDDRHVVRGSRQPPWGRSHLNAWKLFLSSNRKRHVYIHGTYVTKDSQPGLRIRRGILREWECPGDRQRKPHHCSSLLREMLKEVFLRMRGNKAREEPGPPAEKLSRNGRWGAEEPTMPNRTHPSATASRKQQSRTVLNATAVHFTINHAKKGTGGI